MSVDTQPCVPIEPQAPAPRRYAAVEAGEIPVVVHPREGTPEVTDTPDALRAVVARFAASHAPVALDVERAGSFRYSDSACLVQIRREDVGTALIDTIALPDLSPLAPALSNAVWILHAADQDLASLAEVGLHPPQLFDTLIAARLLGYERFGLAAVCQSMLGVTLDKNHQNSNWSTRPLPRSWLRYAALDVELLTDIYREQGRELYRVGRWEWCEQECEHERTLPLPTPDPQRWRHLPGAGKIRNPRQLAVLEELWLTRERIARDTDQAPTRLIKHATLVELAVNPPRRRRQLLAHPQLRSPRARAHTDEWLSAIARGLNRSRHDLPPVALPSHGERIPPPGLWKISERAAFDRLQCLKRHIRHVADALGIDQAMLLDPALQRRIAWHSLAFRGSELRDYLAHHGARPWQINEVGDAVDAAIADFDSLTQ